MSTIWTCINILFIMIIETFNTQFIFTFYTLSETFLFTITYITHFLIR